MSLPPAQPAYILRGHSAQIHATTFIRSNSRLVTGDAEGWIVIWSLATKRATAVWRAHEAAILGSASWGKERLITHGKNNKLIVWKLREEDEENLSNSLPVDDPASPRKQPWILHILHVNTLNFCSFAYCKVPGQFTDASGTLIKPDDPEELLIAVPNALTSEAVDVFHLPSEKRLYTISGDQSVNTGMVMALAIFYQGLNLTIVSAFESGHTTVSQQIDSKAGETIYNAQTHSQPILSLSVSPDQSFYLTSGADAVVAKHPIPSSGVDVQTKPLKIAQTKHSGQQGLTLRSDGKIFATAGWDSRVRVYSAQSLRELAVLKWHKEGCYAVAFADVVEDEGSKEGRLVADEINDKEGQSKELVSKLTGLTVKEKRIQKANSTHWLAAGSKDGKVSLWDIY